MTTEARGWELRIHNGDGDTELAVEFCRTPLAGVHQITTVEGLVDPELLNPEGAVVATGTKEIQDYLLLAQESQSC